MTTPPTTQAPKSDFIHILQSRGFYQDCTHLDELDQLLAKQSLTAYIGFDCTAPSLHVGSLMQIMMLHWWQKTGNRPIVLMGGGTTKIGDPSGKDEARQILTPEIIAQNKQGIAKNFAHHIHFGEGATDAMMVDNADWLDKLEYIPFLRDIGRHFSINRMLSFDSVKLRLERDQPLSFLEFNYMLLQAYDYHELSKRFDCRLQMGGSDQWGNIVNGIELTRRTSGKQVFGLTSPLLTTASGQKMGKTASGAVWLCPDMLKPFDFWQFWRNCDDADVGRFLKLFTTLPLDEIERLATLKGSEINDAKIILADQVTMMMHGQTQAEQAKQAAQSTFIHKEISDNLPTVFLDGETPTSLTQLIIKAGMAQSGKEAKRLITEGGVRLNDKVIQDTGMMVEPSDLADGVAMVMIGKKRPFLIKKRENNT